MTNCNEDNTPDFVKLVPFGVGNVLVADTQKVVFIGEFKKVCSEEEATYLIRFESICLKLVLLPTFYAILKKQFLASLSNSFHYCVGTVLVTIFS